MEKEKNKHPMKPRNPDLSERPYKLTVERQMALQPTVLFQAWTTKFGVWFAVPDSVLMQGKVDTPFFFETEFEGARHPHYGRFLRVEPDRLIEITWVNGPDGTKGNETVVTVTLNPQEKGTLLTLTHAGFPDENSLNRHKDAWPVVLEQLEKKMNEYTRKD